MSARQIRLSINGREYTGEVEPRKLLTDFLRDDLGLTGTHVGCEHGVCGACTILLNGEPVRSCLLFAVQANGADLKTVEGIAPNATELHPLQEKFWELHGLQCGFCTPGILLTAQALLKEIPNPERSGDSRMAQRQPVPLHRLSKYRHGNSGSGENFERAANLNCIPIPSPVKRLCCNVILRR